VYCAMSSSGSVLSAATSRPLESHGEQAFHCTGMSSHLTNGIGTSSLSCCHALFSMHDVVTLAVLQWCVCAPCVCVCVCVCVCRLMCTLERLLRACWTRHRRTVCVSFAVHIGEACAPRL
jgi:hypothetical protein